MNIIRIIGLVSIVAAFFIIVIIVGIKKERESQQSILLRIIANYLQLLTAALSFNLKFPKALTQLMYPAERIGNSSEAFLSFDCFIRDSEVKVFTPSTAIFKIFLTGLLPISLILLAIVVWLTLAITCRSYFRNTKRNIAVTIIVILFLLHPMLTKVGLEIFQCVQVDENQYQVKVDLNIECYSNEHLMWCACLGVPIILIWSIGCPVLAFIMLFRSRHSLQEPSVQRYLLMLYQGLKDKAFYWELVNTIRKIVMIAINAFMSTIPLVYAASTAVLVLIGLIRLQIRLQPYKLELNNKLEIEAMITGTATLFCGVLFISDEDNMQQIVLFVLVVIMIINIKFFLFWLLCMTSTFVHKHELIRSFYNILAIATCKKKLSLELLTMNEGKRL